ncbi:MAG: sigma 54-interacting transcriptional regulator [Myxococcales bacterium]|nr:sigma 54-interacting transcriptional regulator [Myxococcales bacterium]MDD9970579.1 sigma 54-interacting transcriptional regulator [Myxococcales bacterium]
MRQASITSYLGPALVLYLVADVAAGRGALEPTGVLMAGTAVLLSLAPLLVSAGQVAPGSSRLAWLGVSAGLSLVRYVDPYQMSMTADLARAVGLSMMGTLLVDLGISLPDRVMPESRMFRRLPLLVGILAVGLLGLSLGPPIRLPLTQPAWLIVPPIHVWASEAFFGLCLQLALAARISRRASRSSPEALASNAWGTMCLVPSALVAWFAIARALLGRPLSPLHVGLVLSIVSGLLVFGHARLIQADHRLQAGTAVRSVVALGLTIALLSCGVALLLPYVPRNRLSFGFAMAASLFGGLALHRLMVPATDAVLAPFRGTLLHALARGLPKLSRSRRLDELAQIVLGTLRAGVGDVAASPRMYFFDPPIEARIDAAGQAHLDNRAMNAALGDRLRASPGALIMRGPLERLMVREPTLRPLIEGLVHLDAMCVVPLVVERELEGALVLPRGRRRSALTLEESEALRDFAQRVGAQATILLSEARAQRRAGASLRARQKAEERLEFASDEVRRLRADAVVLRAGRAAHQLHTTPIAYSENMRRFLERLEAVASSDAPVFLQAEGGTHVPPLAFRLHETSGRAGEAFVIGDCSAVKPDASAAALFGDGGNPQEPGWLRLATGGTLVLLDVPALPRSVQLALAEAIATRRAHRVGDAEPYGVSVRLVACARDDIEALAAEQRFEPELAQRLLTCRVGVPPLRARKEDLESLVLLAIDRACRVQGRDPVGLEADAREALMGHRWPGNQSELNWVIERAVGCCQGRRITLSDLPEAFSFWASGRRDPLEGTLQAVERRALQRALWAAGGNKSEAARLLGLKRTTFLDKLRRHDLDEGAQSRTNAMSS